MKKLILFTSLFLFALITFSQTNEEKSADNDEKPKAEKKEESYFDIINDKAITSNGLFDVHKIDDKYYYLTIFKNENFSVYLSLFSELKHKSFDFLVGIDLLRPDLNNLIIFLNNSEPHNLFISAYFFGGIIFLIALIFLILKALKKSIYTIKDNGFIEMNFFILFILLVVESLLWDSYDSLIFLLVLTFINSYLYQTKSAN